MIHISDVPHLTREMKDGNNVKKKIKLDDKLLKVFEEKVRYKALYDAVEQEI